MIEKAKILFRLIGSTLIGKYKPNKWNLILGFLSIVYIISPLDFIPEIAIGPIGLIDDAAILVFAYSRINKEIKNFLQWENQNKSDKNIITIE